MAVSLETLIGASVRNMGDVHPRTKEYAVELVKRAYANGIKVVITSGLRSMTEQARLYGQGRSSYIYKGKQYARAGNVVTQAEPGESIHNYGYAIDFALMTESGGVIWDMNKDANGNNKSDWREVAAIGKSMGFHWGGDWTQFKDYPHLDLGGLTWRQMKAGKRPTVPPVPARTWLGLFDTGPAIQDAQKMLNAALGLKLDVDGIFGEATEKAVERFQRSEGLTVDGIIGKATAAALAVAANEKKGSTVKPAAKPVVSAENEGENVLLLTKRQREEMAKIYGKAKEDGVFSSSEHSEEMTKGKMTQDKAIYLATVLAGAAINNARIK